MKEKGKKEGKEKERLERKRKTDERKRRKRKQPVALCKLTHRQHQDIYSNMMAIERGIEKLRIRVQYLLNDRRLD